MTKKKLEIIGPYTPEHEGPYVLKCEGLPQCFVHAAVNGKAFITMPSDPRPGIVPVHDICNAREAPVAREFWVNEYSWGFGPLMLSDEEAWQKRDLCQFIRTIHVREVLPGDDQ